MRPRRIRRGNLVSIRYILVENICFNEAAANSPRKLMKMQDTEGGPLPRFNEAAANSPRKQANGLLNGIGGAALQ